VLRASGTSVDEEHAGVMVEGAPARIVGNRLEDVFYGVYLKEAPGSRVIGNRIQGKPFARPRRGDGIRLWYSPHSRIEANEVVGTRDVVVYFSQDLDIVENRIAGGRFGLHYMYSDSSRIVGNRLTGNEVGAFLMYSSALELWGNVFHRSVGATGIGLGLKDSDAVTGAGNLFLENAVGLHLDNSPRSRDLTNIFVDNAFVRNGSGVRWMPSVAGNRFERNDFSENLRPVEVSGGAGRASAGQNAWVANRWSDYAGFDADGDGTGDTPYVHARLSDEMTSKHPALLLFAMSPAFGLLELLGRFFPMLEPTPVLVDPAPRVGPSEVAAWRDLGLVGAEAPGAGLRAAHGAGWALAAAGAIALLVGTGRRRG
jgi:nitrous oxidase accessory protein